MKVVVVIPAYNEGASIRKTVQQLKNFTDVIVVSDCSTDQTESEANHGGALVFQLEKNMGYDGALNFGFLKALELGYTHGISVDGDGQHPTDKIPEYIRALAEYDLVIGVRPTTARFSEFLFALYANIKYGVKDPLCGMKGYRLSELSKKGSFDSYSSIGTDFMFYLLKNKIPFCQISIPIAPRVGSSRFGSVIRGNYKIIRALIRSIFIGY